MLQHSKYLIKNISSEFRLKYIEETKNYFINEIYQKELMSNKNQNLCTALSYIKCFLILASVVTRCISISAFDPLLDIPVVASSSHVESKICAITAEKRQSIIKKKGKKHDKIVLLGKSKFISIEALISRALVVSYISHDEFVLVKNVLKE